MSFIITMLMIFFIAAFFSIVFNTKFDTVAALPFFLIIITTYIFGLLGDLRYGVFAIIVFSIFCFVFMSCYCLRHIKTLKASLSNIVTAGFYAFVAFLIIMLVGHLGRPLENWDEFAHWGATVKGMYYNNTFSTAENSAILAKHEAYPPGTALLHYFFTKCSGTYHESNMIRSMCVFAFSLFLPVFSYTTLKKENLLKSISFFFVIFLLPTVIYSDFYVTLYVDGILGCVFAYMLYIYFSERKITPLFLAQFCSAAFVITLIKSSGVAFVIISLFLIFIDVIFFHHNELNHKRTVLSSWKFLFPILCVFISKYSWNLYIEKAQLHEWKTSAISFSAIKNLFTNNIADYQLEGINEFIKKFTTVRPWINNTRDTAITLTYPIYFSYVIFTVMIIITGIIIAQLMKKTRPKKSTVTMSILLAISFIGYSISLLLLYLFTFEKWEITSCAAMDRYLGTFVLGVLLFMTFMLLQAIPSSGTVSKLKLQSKALLITILVLIISFANMNSIANITVSSRFDIARIQQARERYHTASSASKSLIGDTGKVLFLSQNNESYYYYNLCRYSLAPLRSTSGLNYALANSQETETKDKLTGLKNALKSYQYVYVDKTDDLFNQYYAELFENPDDIQDDTFFVIDKKDADIKLIKLNIS